MTNSSYPNRSLSFALYIAFALAVIAVRPAAAPAQPADKPQAIAATRAIQTALAEAPTAKAIGVELAKKGTSPVYRVELLDKDGVRVTYVSAADGTIVRFQEDPADRVASKTADELRKAYAKAGYDLSEAITVARGATRLDDAYLAEFTLANGKAAFKVALKSEGRFAEVTIDAGSPDDVAVSWTDKVAVRLARDDGGKPRLPWNFDEDSPGKLPAKWAVRETASTNTPATWSVIADETAPSRPHAFAVTKAENHGQTYNLAVLEADKYGDLDLTVSVKGVSGQDDQGGGPIWRCKDADNYYVCRFNPLEGNYRVYSVINGRRKQLASADVETDANKWYQIRVTMIGPKITCYIDGQKHLEVSDETLAEPGFIGLWTKADAVTSFDDLTVKPPSAGN